MKNKTLILTLILLCGVSVAHAQLHTSENEIKDLIHQIDNALVKRDYIILNQIYADNMKLIAPNGYELTKEIVLSPFKNPNRKTSLTKIINENLHITVYDQFAYATMKTTHYFKEDKSTSYKNVYLFRNKDNQWKLQLITSILLK